MRPSALPRRVEILGVPFNSDGSTGGVARAPAALRQAGLVEAIIAAGVAVTDLGDVALEQPDPKRDPASHVIGPDALTHMIRRSREQVSAILHRGAFPLVLGGDCPVLIGCIAGAATAAAASGDPRLLFVDGHEDAWPPERSTTGEAADMELGWLVGEHLATLPAALRKEIPTLGPDDVVVVGARDEAELAGVGVASLDRVVRFLRPPSIVADPAVVSQAVSELSARGPWWLHVDLDVLDTTSLAAVDYPQAGGLDWPTLTGITTDALADPRVLGWDLTIYNPDLDRTGDAAAAIVRSVARSLATAF